MYCMTLTTPTPERVAKTLRKSKVQFQVVRTVEAGTLKGAQNPEVALAIYEEAERGLVYGHIATRHQVSFATVLRLVHNPRKYGLDKPPIRRLKQT